MEGPESDRLMWQQRAQTNPVAFRQDLVQAFLGEGSLHSAQQQTLDLLDAGRSVLTVMGTGRGKSLIFQIHAAELALGKQMASLFVYPLRALVADQAFHLERTLGSFGITVGALTGATPAPERAQVMADLVPRVRLILFLLRRNTWIFMLMDLAYNFCYWVCGH